jgi:16S rRNA (guanine(966)-N(2))-methyltransferase RsmD
LFNIIGPEVRDAVFLDLFAGTGSIGLEALSRGAREVVFIESSEEGSKLIHKNLDLCGIRQGQRVLIQDVFTSLRQIGREALRADIIYMDPPYGWKPYKDLLEVICRTGIAHENSRIVIEHHKHSGVPAAGRGFRRTRLLRQSNKCLSFFTIHSSRNTDD